MFQGLHNSLMFYIMLLWKHRPGGFILFLKIYGELFDIITSVEIGQFKLSTNFLGSYQFYLSSIYLIALYKTVSHDI